MQNGAVYPALQIHRPLDDVIVGLGEAEAFRIGFRRLTNWVSNSELCGRITTVLPARFDRHGGFDLLSFISPAPLLVLLGVAFEFDDFESDVEKEAAAAEAEVGGDS
ncbi:hypothetical protein C1H46_006498 [Malus baccata]|uniref:Uncharacterized protein n=1 Tax=Malus baccata TaxID=106549 RepID=A0A540NAA3_MALBA|nr:hypothetical protein C1H46_006498 [Malus baccata]